MLVWTIGTEGKTFSTQHAGRLAASKGVFYCGLLQNIYKILTHPVKH
jgi:hypothetical protein